jgi:hypothetical protein
MASVHSNVLSNEELEYLNNLPEVLKAKSSLDARPSGMVYFSVPVTTSIRDTLQSRFGLELSVGSSIPMRWIKGDTTPHVDIGASRFQNTYLVYLNDSPGELVIDSQSYPIQMNTGFVFNEGLSHKTQNTQHVPRLLMGPMNEFAEPVGALVPILYYPTEADALNYTNSFEGGSLSYQVGIDGPFGPGSSGYTSWRIASNSIGTFSTSLVYTNGTFLDGELFGEPGFQMYPQYFLYPAAPCFLEGSTILCQVDGVETYVPVEELEPGTFVKTSLNGYKQVVLLGKGSIRNPGNSERTENRLYRCSPSNYPQLTEDLYITGCHSILELRMTDRQKDDTIKHLGRLFVTDKKFRLMACLDERAEPWNSEGSYTIWHFALEHHDDGMNYGVYANGGLLVETCSIRTLKNKSNMTLS